jgi:hypothetical protein
MKIWLIIFITCFINSQIVLTGDLCLLTAKHFMEREHYDQAITEYLRFIFFSQRDGFPDPDQEMISEAFYNMGICYRNQFEWEKAVQAINKSITYTSNDSIREERKLAIAIIRITSTSYSAAEMELLRLVHFSKINSIKQKARFFLGICQIYQFKWQDAQYQFKEYYLRSVQNKDKELNLLLEQANRLHYKSPGKATWFSTFIPGTGQIYSGDLKNGINALAISLLTGYLLIDAWIDKSYQDFFISYLGLFWRYYQGNRANARYLSEEYNKNLNGKTAQKILNYLKMHYQDEVK